MRKRMKYIAKRIFLLFSIVALLASMNITSFAATDKEAAEYLISLKNKYDLTPKASEAEDSLFPEKWDLREFGYVTPVKMQNPFGTCWGFSAIAAAETSILSEMGKTYEETKLDLSEHQLAYFARKPLEDGSSQSGEGYYLLDEKTGYLNTGGWFTTATSVFSSGIGPVDEYRIPYRGKEGIVDTYLFFPYGYSDEDDWSVPEDYRFLQKYELEDSNILPDSSLKKWNELKTEYEYLGFDPKGVEAMKSELLQGRAISIAFAADQYLPGESGTPKYLSDNYCHYVYDAGVANHAVTIVGWDDTIPASDFIEGHQPPADGAWIVKNSWGAETEEFPNQLAWGMKDKNGKATGYFYLSYYDQSIVSPESLNFDVNEKEGAYIIDQFDYMANDSMNIDGWQSDEVMKAANIFTAEYDQKVREISTEVSRSDADVTVELYLLEEDCKDPEDGLLAALNYDTFEYAGFHKVELSEPVEIKAGQKYSIIVTQSVDASDLGYGTLYEVMVDQARTKDGLEDYNSKVEEDMQERCYGKAVVNPGESWLYSQGGWNDWSEVLKDLREDPDYSKKTYDNFGIKAYAELSDAELAVSLSGNLPDCCYPEPTKTYQDYMDEYAEKLFILIVAAVILAVVLISAIILYIVLGAGKRKWKKRALRVLFIGNSHTYYNDMPSIFLRLAQKKKRKMAVTMVAHPGWFLKQHLEDGGHEAEFNLRHGAYDYVVLQEHTHPFEEETSYLESIRRFCAIAEDVAAMPVIYATWAKKDMPQDEAGIEELQRRAAQENSVLYAPVGEKWWKRMEKEDLFGEDGQHANIKGSTLAAEVLWDVIGKDSVSKLRWKWYKKNRKKRKTTK